MEEYLYEGLKTEDAQNFLAQKGIPKKNQPKTENGLATLYDITKRTTKEMDDFFTEGMQEEFAKNEHRCIVCGRDLIEDKENCSQVCPIKEHNGDVR